MHGSARSRLFALLRERSFQSGNFVLASGSKSNYYIDGKMTEVCSEGAFLIGEVIYEYTKDWKFNAIGGLAVGAVPLVTSAVISFHNHGRTLEGFWVREEPKAHGTKKVLEGKLPEGARVVIVDDVITSGASVVKAIEEVESRGGEVVMILAIVDRASGARELFEGKGYHYQTVFPIEEFGVTPNVPQGSEIAS